MDWLGEIVISVLPFQPPGLPVYLVAVTVVLEEVVQPDIVAST